jgi:hypothetical protein
MSSVDERVAIAVRPLPDLEQGARPRAPPEEQGRRERRRLLRSGRAFVQTPPPARAGRLVCDELL